MAEQTRPLPAPDLDSKPYWDAARQHKLMMQKCRSCGHISFPPHHYCRGCRGSDLEWTEVSGKGTVYTFSIMHDNLVRGLDPPFVLAQVELEEQSGLRLIANIQEVDPKAVRIGMPVRLIFEDVSADISLPQFVPAER